jgi:hypothetical protein
MTWSAGCLLMWPPTNMWPWEHPAARCARPAPQYMDRTYVVQQQVTPVYALGLELWRNVVLRWQPKASGQMATHGHGHPVQGQLAAATGASIGQRLLAVVLEQASSNRVWVLQPLSWLL